MNRLYVRIYLAFLGVCIASAFLAATGSIIVFGRPLASAIQDTIALSVAVSALDPASPGYQAELEATVARFDQRITVYDKDGRVVAEAGRPALLDVGPSLSLPLGDGRELVLRRPMNENRRRQGLLWVGLALGCVAVGCYPVARGITRRLEDIERAVGLWGKGDLQARAPVSGRDEVASVARAFNQAAERVEELFTSQQRVLVSASHELRSPLARLRMALELVSGDEDMVAAAIRDVEELDRTVGDVLRVGRMQAAGTIADPRPVDLRALVVEEAGRVGASVSEGEPNVVGDTELLRRLVRNLLENAARHGAPPIEVTLQPDGLWVEDCGSGVPDVLRERIFEPFFRPESHAEGRDGGVGLGLHLVRQIARHHHGSVHVEARPGGGSRFVVRLGAPA